MGRVTAIILAIVVIVSMAYAATNYYLGTDVISPNYGAGPPVKGGEVTEPFTGATLKRLTDIAELTPDLPADALVVYSRFSPTNTSGEYILVHGSDSTSCWVVKISDQSVVCKLSDGAEFGENHEIRWDYTGAKPNTIYFVRDMSFYEMDVITSNGTATLVHNFLSEFPSGVKIINDVEGDSSNDSRYWAWMVLGQTIVGGIRQPDRFIVYDKQLDTIIGQYGPEDNPNYSTYLPKPNMVEITPTSNQVLLHYGIASNRAFNLPGPWVSDGGGIYHMVGYKAYSAGNNVFSYIRDDGVDLSYKTGGEIGSITGPGEYANSSLLDTMWVWLSDDSDPTTSTITGNWGSRPDDDDTELDGPHVFNFDFSNPVKVSIGETHSGWAFDENGKDVFISQDNTRDKIQACWADGTGGVYPNNCIDVLDHLDFGSYISMHFGKFYDNSKRGWFQLSSYRIASSGAWGDNQIVMIELKPREENPVIWRIAPTFNAYEGNYRDEGAVAMGFDGNSIYWTGNWGDSVTGHGEVYEVKLPTDWNTAIGTPTIKPGITATALTTTTDSSITITGTATPNATSGSAITSVTCDGQTVTGTTSWSATVPLDVGANSFVFIVTDAAGETATSSVMITRTVTPSGDTFTISGCTIQGVTIQ